MIISFKMTVLIISWERQPTTMKQSKHKAVLSEEAGQHRGYAQSTTGGSTPCELDSLELCSAQPMQLYRGPDEAQSLWHH